MIESLEHDVGVVAPGDHLPADDCGICWAYWYEPGHRSYKPDLFHAPTTTPPGA